MADEDEYYQAYPWTSRHVRDFVRNNGVAGVAGLYRAMEEEPCPFPMGLEDEDLDVGEELPFHMTRVESQIQLY